MIYLGVGPKVGCVGDIVGLSVGLHVGVNVGSLDGIGSTGSIVGLMVTFVEGI